MNLKNHVLWAACLVGCALPAQAAMYQGADSPISAYYIGGRAESATVLNVKNYRVTQAPRQNLEQANMAQRHLLVVASAYQPNVRPVRLAQITRIKQNDKLALKPAADTAPPGRLISQSFFGMHIHRADSTTVWPNAAFGSYRAWDANVLWANLEPSKGRWDFSRLDKLVNLSTNHGVSVLITFGGTPAWASARPAEDGAYGKGTAAEPRDFKDWENYVRTVATRYRGRVKMYELANEPYFSELDADLEQRFFSGSVHTMVAMAASAKKILKEIDPEIALYSPGFDNRPNRLDLFLKSGGGQYIDGVAVHLYTSNPKPEFMLDSLKAFKSVMVKHGIKNMPIICTEIGYDEKWIPKREMLLPFKDLLAAYVARAHVLGAAAGLDRLYWYSWDGLGGGMAEPNSRVLNKVGIAYMQVMRWLKGANIQGCKTADNNLWTCELNLGTRAAWVVWNTEGSKKWSVPPDWHALQYETLDARLLKLDSNAVITVGPSPVLIQSDGKLWSAY